MARASAVKRKRAKAASNPVQGRCVATPSPDLWVIKVRDRYQNLRVSPEEQAPAILAKLARAISKPGIDRSRVFQSSLGKTVYAYSALPEDPTKLVREDASGRKTIGRLVNGRFRRIKQL